LDATSIAVDVKEVVAFLLINLVNKWKKTSGVRVKTGCGEGVIGVRGD
jgi:hypothetical protein